MINGLGDTSIYNYGGYNSSIAFAGTIGSTGSAKDAIPSESELKSLKQTGAVECSTCASRKYQDGSDENVSYKSASHIDPSFSGSKVMAHEQEHVSNAYSKAAKGGGQVISASVTLKTAICPECGRSYVSGGVTNTAIKYNENNPYGGNQKSADYSAIVGMNLDTAV